MLSSLTQCAHAEAVRLCFLRKRPHGKDGCESHCWIGSIVLVFRIERMTGFEPAVSCLGSRRAATAPHPRCEGWDSNPRPPGYGPGGLPNCPTPHSRAFPGTPHGRGVFRTARKGPFPGGGEKGPAYAGRPSPPSTPWRNRTSVDGFGDRRTATVLMAYCVFRSSIVKRPRRLPGFVPVRRHATVCVPVAGAIPYGVSHLMGEPDAGRRDDQEHAYRQACPERPCDPQYPQYGLHSEPQPPVDGGRAQKREHPEQRHLQGRLPSCGNHDRPLSP